jgi:hypothetical protein
VSDISDLEHFNLLGTTTQPSDALLYVRRSESLIPSDAETRNALSHDQAEQPFLYSTDCQPSDALFYYNMGGQQADLPNMPHAERQNSNFPHFNDLQFDPTIARNQLFSTSSGSVTFVASNT